MTLLRLILQNIRYYKRQWLLVLSGTIIGTAVITGALITGDSVKDSLRQLVNLRLGKTSYALTSSDRYFRYNLSSELSHASGIHVFPLLRVRGIATEPSQNITLNRVEVIGTDERFGDLWNSPDTPSESFKLNPDEAIVSENVARHLNLQPGSVIILKIGSEGFAPANAPFVSEQVGTSGTRLKIRAIAGDNSGGLFNLEKNQTPPFNIFISWRLLSTKMGIPGFVNTLLADTEEKLLNAADLNKILQQTWTPADAGLVVSTLEPGLSQVTSGRIFIDDTLSDMIRRSLPDAKGVLTYLVNELSFRGRSTPYSFVTAADPGIGQTDPAPGKIVINNWLAEDLKIKSGDSLKITFWVMGPGRSLMEKSAGFLVHSIIPVSGSASERELMPSFPGMKQSGNCRDWETGAPVNLGKIRDKDEKYWNLFRGTPKAWISLSDGSRIWKNPFGNLTAFRFYDTTSQRLLGKAIHELTPSALGLTFTPVLEEGVMSAGKATDFGELFLGLGGLILFSGLILSGMLLSFFLGTRSAETSLLRALGFNNMKIMHILLSETIVITMAGCLLGALAAVLYSKLILIGLNTLWQGAVNTSALTISIHWISLVTGFFSGVILNLGMFAIILFRQRKHALPSTYRLKEPKIIRGNSSWKYLKPLAAAGLFGTGIIIIIIEYSSGRFYTSPSFMVSGLMVLTGMIIVSARFLTRKNQPEANPLLPLWARIRKNLSLQKAPALTAIILLSLGTFTVLVTGLNRKSPGHSAEQPGSGTGGFRLWMETTMPVLSDLNSAEGRNKAGLGDEPLPANITFVPLPGIQGDDASCLNLNQVTRPALMGVPALLFDSGKSFSFTSLDQEVDHDHPWKTLEKVARDGCINGFADQTVITWGLHKKIGDTLKYIDEQGKILNIKLSGGLNNSLFQGRILISAKHLREYFPSSSRVRTMLVNVPESSANKLIGILENRMHDQGAFVVPAHERLASFEVVENTYLDVFIMLGGLALIIGTGGFAVMIMRNLRERERELALCSALGIPPQLTRKIVAGEFLFILLSGVLTGIVAALAGTLPSIHPGNLGSMAFAAILALAIPVTGILWILLLVKKNVAKHQREPISKMM